MTTIGKVSLRVWPDTRNFKKETKDGIEKAVADLQAEIPVVGQTEKLKEDVKLAVKGFNAEAAHDPELQIQVPLTVTNEKALDELKARLKELQDETVEVKVDVDRQALDQMAESLDQTLKDKTEHINFDVNNAELEKLLDGLQDNITEKVNVEVDESAFDKFKRELSEGINQTSKIGVSLDEDKLKAIKAKLDEAFFRSDQKVNVKPEFDSKAFAESLAKLKTLPGLRDFKITPGLDINSRDVAMLGRRLEEQFKNIKVEVGSSIDVDKKDLASLGVKIEGALRGFKFKVPPVQVDGDMKPIETKLGLLSHKVVSIPVNVVSKGLEKLRASLEFLKSSMNRLVIEPILDKPAVARMFTSMTGVMATMKALSRLKIAVSPDLKEGEFLLAVEKLRAEAKIRSINLSIGLQQIGLSAKFAEVVAKMKLKADLARIAIKLGVDATGAEGKLAVALLEMRKFVRPIKVGLELAKGALLKTREEIGLGLKNIRAKVDVVTDNKAVQGIFGVFTRLSGARLHYKLTFDVVDALKNADVMLPKLGALSLAFGNVASAAISSVGSIAGYAHELVGALPGLVAMPGIYMGIAAGVTAAAVPLKNFQKELPEVAKQFTAIGDSMTTAFYGEAKTAIESLANATIPKLSAGMSGLSAAEGGFFARLAGDLQKDVVPQLLPFLNGMAAAIRNNTGLADGLSKAFGGFIQIGVTYVPQLINFVSNLVGKFGALIQANVANGNAFTWVETAKSVIKDLFNGIVALVSSILSIGKAANDVGLGSIHALSVGLQGLADILKRPEVQKGMGNLFKSASDGVKNLVSGALPGLEQFAKMVGSVLTSVMPQVGSAAGALVGTLGKTLGSKEMQTSLTGFFNNLVSAVKTLLPYLKDLGTVFSAVLDVLGSALTSLAPIVGRALDGVGPALKKIVPDINSTIKNLATGLGAILDSIMPAIQKVVPAIGKTLSTLGAGLGKSLVQIAPTMATVENALGDLIANNLPKLADLITKHILPVLVQWIQKIGPAVVDVIHAVSKALPSVIDFVGKAVDALGKFIGSFSAKDIQGAARILTGLIGVIKGIADALSGLIGGDHKKFVDGMKEIGTNLINGLVKGIGSGLKIIVKALWELVKGLLSAFKSMLGIHSPSTVFADFGGNIVEGLVNGIKGIASKAWDAIKDVATGIYNGFKSAISATGDWLGGVGSSITSGLGSAATAIGSWFSQHAQDLYNGFLGMANGVGNALSGLWNTVSGAFTTVATNIGNWFTSAWTTVTNGFTTIVTDAGNALSGLWDTIKTAFDTVFTNVSQWVIGFCAYILSGWGIILTQAGNALSGLWGAIKTAWDTVTTNLGSWFTSAWTTVTNGFTTVVTNAGNAISGLWNAIVGAWNTVTTNVGNWFTSAWTTITNGFTKIVSNAGSGISGLWNAITGAWNTVTTNVGSWFSSAWTKVSNGFKTLVSNAKDGISGLWNDIKGAWDTVTNNIGNWFSNAWTKVSNGFSTIVSKAGSGISGLWNTITGAFNTAATNIGNWLSGTADKVFNGAKGFVSSLGRGLGGFASEGKKAIDDMWDSMKNALEDVKSWFGDIPHMLFGYVDWAGSLISAGWEMMSGLATAIYQGASSAVHNALSWVTSMIPHWKGPLPVDKVLLVGAGEAIMQSLVDGINNGAEGVRDVLSDLTEEIRNSVDVKAAVDLSATSTSNARAINSAALSVDPAASSGTSSGANVNVNVVNPDPYVAARITSDQLKFVLGA